MTKILVNLPTLWSSAQQMEQSGDSVQHTGSALNNAGHSAPSYDGQFGPWVMGVASEGSGRSKYLGVDVGGLGFRVGKKANEFYITDNGAIVGLNGANGAVLEWLKKNSFFLSLAGIFGLNGLNGQQWQWLLKYLRIVSPKLIPFFLIVAPGLIALWYGKTFGEWVLEANKQPAGPKLPDLPVPKLPYANFTDQYSDWTVSGGFGVYSPFGRPALHNGIDVVASGGDKSIYPIGPGNVSKIEFRSDLGWYAVIDHKLSDGTVIQSTYAHMEAKPKLKEGGWIDGDKEIGTMGDTGDVTGAHTHLTINYKETTSQDKWTFLDTLEGGKSPTDIVPGTRFTYEEQMRKVWIDPTPYVEGNANIEFVKAKW